ncbi:family S53 protease [Exidia glandulosa HHB12029]|uniref:tripeptidyl-peptidase II n=1 Tax=Exidia glandulosa HHB12029 TaxID=1314781 RepID=A0A165LX34_EXIGL|nr:family S53 protease [Exidia glandulosa HHB12029]
MFSFLALSLLVSLAVARPTMVVHERIHAAPAGFSAMHSAPASTMLNMRIALKQNDISGLEDALMAVSDPASALYGQHLTKEQVEAFVRPKPETMAAVNAFLVENGINATSISPAGDWLAFSIPVSKANDIFESDYTVFSHAETGTSAIRTLGYSIPASLRGAIDLVHPTITFPNTIGLKPSFSAPVPTVGKRQVPASCSSTITPACLQALYGIPTTRATQSSNILAVSGFIEQYANQADLTQFLRALRTDNTNATFTTQLLDGGSNPQTRSQAGVEANLDIQYTVGIATGVPTQFISVGENFKDGALEGFLDIINALLAESNPPTVLTTSYGQNENTISRSLATQLCNAYMQLGARGTTILFASGDGGVAGSQSARCTTFVPTFPSGCPYMTSVGATQGINPERAASFSSGGFSNYFAIPSYQASAVAAFKTRLGSTNSGKFNTTGRGFPDVSAQGVNFEVVVDAQTGTVSGTSASSPLFASIVSLVNDRLIAAGKSPLGFLNPFLYSAAGTATLTDITAGNNPGALSSPPSICVCSLVTDWRRTGCSTNGFTATTGWDPVTGLGTPNFALLLNAAMAL